MIVPFAAGGANLVLNGFGRADDIEALRAKLAADHRVTVRYDAADMTKPGEIEAMMKKAIAEFGVVDVLVNNAGIQHVAPIDEFPVEKWNAIIAINLVASFHTIRHALPRMKSRKWGRIINIASAHALVASPFKSAYVAAKHGVAGLTKTVALEVAELGITVNAICPGYVRTALVEKQIPDTAKARGITEEQVVRDVLLAAQSTKQFVTVGQVASLAAYLASDDAASGGPAWDVLRGHEADPTGSALALRFMGAVHRVVLQGRAPELARFYPSVDGTAAGDPWPAFRSVLGQHAARLREDVTRPVQTNEVGRSAALLGGFLLVAGRTGLPLRVWPEPLIVFRIVQVCGNFRQR